MSTTQAVTDKLTAMKKLKSALDGYTGSLEEVQPIGSNLNTRSGTDKIKILLDLKPAFDGYAGIPQEARLLFRGLRTMAGYDVEGLIQHGARKLRSAVAPKGKIISVTKRINQLSRVIVSLYENPYSSRFDKVIHGVENYFALALLRLRALTKIPLTPGVFESDLFDDFIWRTFFSKTLKPSDKALVTAARYRILASPKKLLHQTGLARLTFLSAHRYVSIDTRGYDFFLAQTPFPARVSPGTRMVVRYHDAIPVLMPHTINDKAFHQASHLYSLQENVRAGAWFSCVSESTRRDLVKIFPEVESRTSVIHNMVSDEYFCDDSPKDLIFQIIRNRRGEVDEFITDVSCLDFDEQANQKPECDYLLMVSTLEPRKNHLLLMAAWERLKFTSMPKLKLVIVGSMGWDQGPILNTFRPWAERGDLFYLNNVPSSELRVLYKHASATVCPSLAEGFDYSGIEAMRCGGAVVSSDIPVHLEVYEDASAYFNPYDADDAAAAIHKVIDPTNKNYRLALLEKGRIVSQHYLPEQILPKWRQFFQSIHQQQEPA